MLNRRGIEIKFVFFIGVKKSTQKIRKYSCCQDDKNNMKKLYRKINIKFSGLKVKKVTK